MVSDGKVETLELEYLAMSTRIFVTVRHGDSLVRSPSFLHALSLMEWLMKLVG